MAPSAPSNQLNPALLSAVILYERVQQVSLPTPRISPQAGRAGLYLLLMLQLYLLCTYLGTK